MKTKKVPERGLDKEMRRQFNRLLDELDSLRPLPSSSVEIDRTSQGYFIRSRGGSGSGSSDNIAPRWG